MFKYFGHFLVATLWFSFSVSGQGQANRYMQTVVAPSPTAASLGKFLETPVSYYTGVPNISVPFYEIKMGGVTIPVSLNYHAGGVKVEEAASSVGLGWALNFGGMITRTVKGRPDEDETVSMGGYFHPDQLTINQISQGPPSTSTQTITLYDKLQTWGTAKVIDAEPDVFSLSLPNQSFKFYYSQEQQKFFTIPYSKIIVEYTGLISASRQWKVIDQEGVIYHFDDYESAVPVVTSNYPALTTVPTSWVLTSIENPRSNSTVNFGYEAVIQNSLFNGTTDISYFPLCIGCSEQGGLIYNYSDMNLRRIKIIGFDEGSIEFNYKSTNRIDVPSDKAIDNIVLKNYLGEAVKKIKLETSYFSSIDLNGIGRLRLDQAIISDGQGNFPQKYLFEYSTNVVPDRKSLSQDLWGYYNGASNTRLVKGEFYYDNRYVSGANRDITGANQVGMLTKVTYPTGGYSQYTYESNRNIIYNPGGTQEVEHALFVYPCQDICDQNSNSAYAYTEVPLTIHSNNGNASRVWAELIQEEPSCLAGCGGNTSISMRMEGVNGTSGTYLLSTSINFPSTIPNGEYKVILEIQTCFSCFYEEAKMLLRYTTADANPINVYQQLVGGLRVKEINTMDGVTGVELKKSYEYSSGYVSPVSELNYPVVTSVNGGSSGLQGSFLKRQSYPAIPLTVIKGGSIGYSSVTEKTLKYGLCEYYTVYEFSNYPDEYVSGEFPFINYASRDHLRGELVAKRDYGKFGSEYIVVKELENEYETITDTTNSTISKGFIGCQLSFNDEIHESADPHEYDIYNHRIGVYALQADRSMLKKTTETLYDYSGQTVKTIKTVQEINYSEHNFKPNKTVVTQSDGTKKINETKYPFDFHVNTTTDQNLLAYKYLINKNVLDLPIETKSLIEQGTAKKLLAGNLLLFNEDGLLKRTEAIETSTPVTSTDVTTITNGNLVKHPQLTSEYEVPKYSWSKKILEQKLTDNAVKSYLWDYSDLYPVAEVTNAAHSDIAYTSFEGDGPGNWNGVAFSNVVPTGGLTGSKFYQQNDFILSKSGLNATTSYVVSYWSKNEAYQVTGTQIGYPKILQVASKEGSVWTLYEHLVSGQTTITITGSGSLDELRLHPKQAQMTTYTFSPLRGISSLADPGNRLSFFEYDSLGRLLTIRDQNGKVLKKYEYQYVSQ